LLRSSWARGAGEIIRLKFWSQRRRGVAGTAGDFLPRN